MKKQNISSLPVLAQNITYHRNTKGFTQAALGKKLGCTQQVIDTYERGIAVPPPQRLAAIARLFGISIDDLVGLTKINHKIKTSNPRLLSKLALVEKLPSEAQRDIVAMIEHLAKAYHIT